MFCCGRSQDATKCASGSRSREGQANPRGPLEPEQIHSGQINKRTLLLAGALMSWDRPFAQPVPLPSGRPARTLREAGEFIRKLPRSERDRPEWRAAIHLLIEAADDRAPTLFAHIGIAEAAERYVEREAAQKALWQSLH